jgi:large subunit ribosomal protein L23
MAINKTSIFDVLVCPKLTYKSLRILEQDQYSFLVNPCADKNSIKCAIEQFFGVKVLSVTTCTRSVRRRRLQLGSSRKSTKRAVVRLASDVNLPFLK